MIKRMTSNQKEFSSLLLSSQLTCLEHSNPHDGLLERAASSVVPDPPLVQTTLPKKKQTHRNISTDLKNGNPSPPLLLPFI
jgi:hypothetical protein